MSMQLGYEDYEDLGSKSLNQRPGSRKILLADDCQDTRAILSHFLENMGMEVTTAENGQECVDRAILAQDIRDPYDLIVVDICMPTLNGNDAAKQIRQNGYLGPIIALTGYASISGRSESLHSGCDSYISKRAIDKDLLRKLVRQYCD